MILFEEAYKIVMDKVQPSAVEMISLQDSLGRVLAKDVFSDMDMPPFNKAAVDGYACRYSDLEAPMIVLESIPAGKAPEFKIEEGQCSKIMTGAAVPEGADTVVMVEHTKLLPDGRIQFLKEKSSHNVCLVGEDLKKGDIVIEKGTLIKPQHIAVMASVGYTKPEVFTRVKVGVISTGDELVEPEQVPGKSQIRNSNASQLMAQLASVRAVPEYIGIALDNPDSTRERIISGLEKCDVLILSGGVSMGDYDFVPQIFKELGIEIKFNSVAIQPGRPTVFCRKDDQYLFGLPGNPVSSFVLFEMLVKPLLYGMMGYRFESKTLPLRMGEDFSRKKTIRKLLLPVRIASSGEVYPVEYHGSAHINAYVKAEGLVIVEVGVSEIKKGEIVDVRQL